MNAQAGIVLAGTLAGAGVALLVLTLGPRPAERGVDPAAADVRLRRWLRVLGLRAPAALAAALLTLVITRWPVAAIAAAGCALSWRALIGGSGAERQQNRRLEALAIWTESLRDTIAAAVGLEQAIIATARSAPAAIRPELTALADRLRVRVPLTVALHQLADDLDDASADLVVAALLLNSRLRGPGLRQVLGSLAESTRADLEMRGRVLAGRASTRRSVQIVLGVTVLFVLSLALFNPQYVAPYRQPTGQLVLAVVIALFAAGFVWLRRLSGYDLPARFLHPSQDRQQGAGTELTSAVMTEVT